MYTWTRRAIVAATVSGCTVLVGCTGQIGSPPSGQTPGATGTPDGSNNGATAGTPGASTTGGGPATGAGNPIDVDGDGNPDGQDLDGDGVIDVTSDCVPGIPGTSQLPRLTRVQYDNTIRDLVGLETQPSSQLAPDSVGSMDQRSWDGFRGAAETLAAQVMADANARSRVVTCATQDDACAAQIIQSFGQKAFRRPLTTEEAARYQALYTNRAQITANGTFDEAIEVIVKAFLTSPSFITRAEIAEQAEGDYYLLDGYEVASRLSYMLWNSMPDDQLFAAAAAGSLSTKEGILAEAQRMLQDPKARTKVASFHQEYAHMGPGTRWAEITRDSAVYPAFSESLVPLISQETQLLFDYIVFDLGGTFQDLLTTPVALVNQTTAPLYGLDPSQYSADFTPVTLDASRPGIFTRLGFLTSHASFNRTSPILRGAFLQKEVLCTDIPPPPPDVEGTPLPTEGLTTNRERVDAQTAAAACANCHHTVINPTGFALESFDAIGQVQATDNGAPVDTAATVPIGSDYVDVTGASDLMAAIATSDEAQRCYAKKWVQHAYQREINPQDSCVVDMMANKLTQGGYTVVNLIADLTQSDSFRYRALEVAQ